MKARLSVVEGKSQGATLELNERRSWTIGRDEDVDLRLHDRNASREHCTVEYDGQYYWLVDNGSVNGTFVNDVPAHRYMLYDGDVIRVGQTVLVFQSLGA